MQITWQHLSADITGINFLLSIFGKRGKMVFCMAFVDDELIFMPTDRTVTVEYRKIKR